jgi:phenylacetate-CoA ligase
MPNSVLEAMACGVPVISTNVGGVPYIVHDGQTALLVEPDNAQQMAMAIVKLHGDKEMRQIFADKGQTEAARYFWSEVRPRWLALYRQCGAGA